MKPKLPGPSVWALSDLARYWGVSEDQLALYVACDGLQITETGIGGRIIPTVTAEEAERFASTQPRASRYNPTERETHLLLLGATLAGYCGGDAELLGRPYALLKDLEQVAAANGVPIPRSDDTNAKAIREAVEVLCAHGYRLKRPRLAPTKPAETPALATPLRAAS